MGLAAYGYVEVRGSARRLPQALACNVKRNGRARLDEMVGPTGCPSPLLPPLHEATGAVASPLMPVLAGYGATTTTSSVRTQADPEQQHPSHPTALTPQNHPEDPCYEGIKDGSVLSSK